MHTVTQEWITAWASPAGGWTRKQLAALGVTWPPPAGWRRLVDGLQITPDQQATFERPPKPKQIPLGLAHVRTWLRMQMLQSNVPEDVAALQRVLVLVEDELNVRNHRFGAGMSVQGDPATGRSK